MSNNKILIVEDDADICLGYQILLKANHYETFLATNAVSAISEALKHHPDLIILDLGLPDSDGFIVLERLRAIRENANLSAIPVIVVSAQDPRGNTVRALKAGAKAFVQKPWNDQHLLALIEKLLRPPEPRPVPERF